jgi:hypothetical protein
MKRMFGLSLLSLLCFSLGCSGKMDSKECDKIRGEAFDAINKAQHCNTDADCSQSQWPGCSRAVNNKTIDAVKPMAENFKKGQCEETKLECKPSPDAYCKQGLCVHREKAQEAPAAPAEAPVVQ